MRLAEDVGPKGYVLATDLSQGMIDDLQVRLDGRPFALVEAKRMPAAKLDVPDVAFDAAVCALGLTLQIRAGPL
jgi:ubiquinone/menaquinone biosynthesis C-methylase UbiE